MIEHRVTVGLKYILEREVGLFETGANIGSNSLDYLLSTPALSTMVIEASFRLLEPLLPEGSTTVGKQLELIHDAPTLIGEKVHVEVHVSNVVGSHIHLLIRAWDRMGEIARGTHERIVVDEEKLMADAYERSGIPLP